MHCGGFEEAVRFRRDWSAAGTWNPEEAKCWGSKQGEYFLAVGKRDGGMGAKTVEHKSV